MSRYRTSPALVVSVIALIAALGGSSYAAFALPKNSVGTRQLKNVAVTTKKIRNGAVTKAKLNVTGVTVPHAIHANTAGSATNAAHASTADSARSVAYAHVLSTGALDAAHSRNISAASKVSTGVYCLKVGVAVTNATATVDVANSSGTLGIASAVLKGEDPPNLIGNQCPAGDNALVATADSTTGTTANRGFWVTFN